MKLRMGIAKHHWVSRSGYLGYQGFYLRVYKRNYVKRIASVDVVRAGNTWTITRVDPGTSGVGLIKTLLHRTFKTYDVLDSTVCDALNALKEKLNENANTQTPV